MATTPLFISLPEQLSLKKNKGVVPLSVITLCNYLHEHGVDAEFLDLGLHCGQSIDGGDVEVRAYNAIADVLRENPPLYAGLNCFATEQFPLLRALADRIRNAFPAIPIAIGGLHPSMFAEDILTNCPAIDYVVIGEGEEQALALVDVCQGNTERLPDIPALGWRKPDGTVVLNPRTGFLETFGTKTHYGWSKVSLADYAVDTSTWNNPKNLSFDLAVPIMTTRSCPFRCSFVTALLVPFPGTPVYQQCVRDNLLLQQIDVTKLYEGSFFLDCGLKELYIKPYNLEIDELLELKRQVEELYCYSERAKRLTKPLPVRQ